jgi:hypothetical protein
MKAYEFPAKVAPGGTIRVPESLVQMLPSEQTVRVMVLVSEPEDAEEQSSWSRLTAEQFLAGYAPADTVYDKLD